MINSEHVVSTLVKNYLSYWMKLKRPPIDFNVFFELSNCFQPIYIYIFMMCSSFKIY